MKLSHKILLPLIDLIYQISINFSLTFIYARLERKYIHLRKTSLTSLMHSGPLKDGLPIAGVTGYHTWRLVDKNDKFEIFCTMYPQSSKYGYKMLLFLLFRQLLPNMDMKMKNHLAMYRLIHFSPKITGIVSVMTNEKKLAHGHCVLVKIGILDK